ncbi:MAG: preprotein translocase subunit YajC [Nitrospirae bacterium]|nr:preprotein translocase subunit YajC [Nitrospirota bacterium]
MLFSLAFAAGESSGSPLGGLWSFLPIILIFPIFYFLVIMPQQKQRKKHQAMLNDLKSGDRVVTSSGIIGTIVSVDKDAIVVQVAPNVKIRMMKGSVSELRTEEKEA